MESRDTRCRAPKGWATIRCKHGSRVWVPLRCRRCLPCLKARRRKIIARIIVGSHDESWVGFLSLTSLPGTTWPYMMAYWSRMCRWLRKGAPSMQYVAVKQEGEETGMRHLHLVVYPWVWIDQAKISAEWLRISGAWNADIRRVNGAIAGAHIAAYVGESDLPLAKIVTYSRSWPKLPKDAVWRKHGVQLSMIPVPRSTIETVEGNLVEYQAPRCDCLEGVRPIEEDTLDWLVSLMGPWPRASPVASVR